MHNICYTDCDMETKIFNIENNNTDASKIEECGAIIKAGGLVAFPTETVYGLGGDGLNPSSSRKIYAAKGRPSDNPLIVHIAEMEALGKIVTEIPEDAKALARVYWPGPLTMIFKKSDIVPLETTGGLNTVAVRFPSDKTAQALIKAGGGYIAAPSANISGRPSPTVAKYVIEDMNGRIDAIIDGGESEVGLESSIVDFSEGHPVILRPGFVTKEMVEAVLGKEVTYDRAIIDADCKTAPKAPGMKYRHYAPKGQLTVVEGDSALVVKKINELAQLDMKAGRKVGIIATEETYHEYAADSVKNIGHRERGDEAAHHLFRVLREFDDENIDVMYSEAFNGKGVSAAVMNRLLKAAGHQTITL